MIRSMNYLLILALTLLTACSPDSGGSSGGGGTLPKEGDQGGTPGNPNNPSLPETPVESIDLNGIISGGVNDQSHVLLFDRAKGQFQVSLPIGQQISVNFTSRQITELPGASIEVVTAADGNRKLVLTIPLRYVLRDVTTMPLGKLPNGDPLPLIPEGSARTLSFNIGGRHNVKIHLYFSKDSAGIFIESSINPYIGASYDVINKLREKLGNYSIVPAKGTFQGGLFVCIHLEPKVARVIDQFIR